MIAQVMARHCANGGMVIAATHDPLPLGQASIRL
jgi:ABC-type transport system involved in cytochrome c biogenesis ATPase subunit